MTRFEVAAAYALGIMLPVMEAGRRRTNFENLPTYLDDFMIGGLLMWAAWAASSGRVYGQYLLVAAWGVLCGGLWGSFFGQLRNPDPLDVSGVPNEVVVLIKGVIYLIAVLALVVSVRQGTRQSEEGRSQT